MTASPSSVSLYLQYIFFQRLLRKFLLDLSSPVSSLMSSHVPAVPLLLISHPGVFWAAVFSGIVEAGLLFRLSRCY